MEIINTSVRCELGLTRSILRVINFQEEWLICLLALDIIPLLSFYKTKMLAQPLLVSIGESCLPSWCRTTLVPNMPMWIPLDFSGIVDPSHTARGLHVTGPFSGRQTLSCCTREYFSNTSSPAAPRHMRCELGASWSTCAPDATGRMVVPNCRPLTAFSWKWLPPYFVFTSGSADLVTEFQTKTSSAPSASLISLYKHHS
jgi:hypothetical protein